MGLVLTVITIAIVVSNLYVKNFVRIRGDNNVDNVLSEEISVEGDIEVEGEIPSESPTPHATNTIPPTSAPATTQPTNAPSNQSGFIYPTATVLENSGTKIRLSSNDNPEAITNWYQNVIKSNNMNVRSFVKTSANNNILNKLAGANSSQEVLVEISKPDGAASTSITITFE